MKARIVTLLALAVMGLLAANAFAAAPRLVNYQGTLTEADGNPLDGNYDLAFRIYPAEAAADPVWLERHEGVPVENGLFNVILGSLDVVGNPFPADLFGGGEAWLGVSVNSDPELLPRMQFTSVPWAMRATVADSALTGAGGGDADWVIDGANIYRLTGNVGIGTATPSENLVVGDDLGSFFGNRIAVGDAGANMRTGLVFGADNSNRSWLLWNVATKTTEIGTREDGTTYSALNLKGGRLGIGTATPAKRLHIDLANDLDDGIRLATGSDYSTVYADFKVTRGGGGLVINSHAGGGTWADISFQTNATTKMFINHAGNVGIGTTSPTTKLHVAGEATVDVLHITGADVAERFPMSDDPDPGTVVAIDRDDPGKLCVAKQAYDRTVAGVVSGAGDLPTGAVLGNLPGQENASAIALSGRVWVKCDATQHPIEPGDLLTSAATPGYAMKVTDHGRAQGAIIGKAMTALESGRGLVLVLVSLQ